MRRTIRLSEQLNREIEAAAGNRGFQNATAFMRSVIQASVRDDQQNAVDEVEQRIQATLDRLGREMRGIRSGQNALFAFVDSLVKTLLTCMPEPGGDAYSQAVARGKSRYDRFLKSVGAGIAGEANSALSELVKHGRQ